jgi:hypothetical protein
MPDTFAQTTASPAPIHNTSVTVFAVTQAAFLAGVLALAARGLFASSSAPSRMPSLRSTPRVVTPLYNEPLVVTDEQLTSVLHKLRPRLRKQQPKINYVDHALRFWGTDAVFADADTLSGTELRQLLTDDKAFTAAWGENTRPLLTQRKGRLEVRVQQGAATSSHVDHTLASLAEVGTPLNYAFTLRGTSNQQAATATMKDLVRSALDEFDVNQTEYEWTTLTLALFAEDGRPWTTASGETIDFDRLARRVMRQRYGQGVCYGNHRLYALCALLRLDDEADLVSDAVRVEIMAHLAEATSRLIATQSPEGWWDRNWPDQRIETKDDELGGPTPRRVLATGHALEWWSIAPKELHPPRETLIRAGQWLVREIEKMDEKAIDDNYTFLTHAGRALALWRGTTPSVRAKL